MARLSIYWLQLAVNCVQPLSISAQLQVNHTQISENGDPLAQLQLVRTKLCLASL
jgi:hypothetical protein